MKVTWREWYNELAVREMTERGTLSTFDEELDLPEDETGEHVAEEIARVANERDAESFRDGGDIVILSPERIVGYYEVTTDYTPSFHASREEEP